jgi:hypothetical protein
MKSKLPSLLVPATNLALATCALWLCGCASSSIKQTWKSPACQPGQVQKIAVLAVAETGMIRQGLENRFVRDLRKQSQDAVATFDLLGLPDIKADKETAAARLRDAGANAILIVRMLDQSTYSRGVQATPDYWIPTMSGYEGYGWYGCYSVAFMNMGVTWGSMKQNLYLDSNLFDLKTGQRLWSAVIETVLKENADRLEVADALVAKVVGAMRKDGVVR